MRIVKFNRVIAVAWVSVFRISSSRCYFFFFCFFLLFFSFLYFILPVIRHTEGREGPSLTTVKTFFYVDCISSSQLSCIFKSSFETVYTAAKAPFSSLVLFVYGLICDLR